MVETISIGQLRITQYPVTWDAKVVEQYRERIRAGEPLDPILIVVDEHGFPIIDGHHRYIASALEGLEDVPVLIFTGTLGNSVAEEAVRNFAQNIMGSLPSHLQSGVVESTKAFIRDWVQPRVYGAHSPAGASFAEWTHGCDALCNNIMLWIARCPHCGKPRPAIDPDKEKAARGITDRAGPNAGGAA